MPEKKKCLKEISDVNPLLASELVKLPELQNDINTSERHALKNLLTIYTARPEAFASVFYKAHRIGLPEHRKYCTPLQALFWLIQDQRFKDLEDILTVESVASDSTLLNSLKKLLDMAWNSEPLILTEGQINRIIDEIRVDSEIEKYDQAAASDNMLLLQQFIFEDFKNDRDIFHENSWAVIYQALENSRWHNFFTVADRLNAPELLDYYIKNHFNFCKTASNGVYLTFYFNKAQCTDAAYFARHMLEQGGYNTFIRSVKWSDDPWDGLQTGAGIIQNDGSYLLVANFSGINLYSGPHSNIAEVDRRLARHEKIIDSRWGAYYPPCYY